MREPQVNESAERLKRAIESANFEQAPELVAAYAQSIKERIKTARDRKERTAILDEARSFLQDRLHLAHVMRAHIATQLRSAVGLAGYQSAAGECRSWEIEG